MKSIILTLLFFCLYGCSTSISIFTSPPGAEIYTDGKLIGKSPIVVKSADLGKEVAGGYLLQLKSDSYYPVWFWIPTAVKNFDGRINLEPFRIKSTKSGPVSASRSQTDKVILSLLEIQNQILTGKDFDPTKLNQIREKSTTLGGAYYLSALYKIKSQDTEGAKSDARKAIELSPDEPDYIALRQNLEEKN